jgi:protein kinase A
LRAVAKDFISKLLVSNPSRRLGGTESSNSKILSEPFFNMYDFARLEKKQYVAPWVPTLRHKADTTYFEGVEDADVDDGADWSEVVEDPSCLKDMDRLNKEFSQL